jgi:hypothetical protein
MLGTMLGSYVSTAEAQEPEHNKELLRYVDPMVLQTVRLPPMPQITVPDNDNKMEPPERVEDTDTVPVICQIQSSATTEAQADSGANRVITDNPLLLHDRRQIPTPYTVGSIDAANKMYCTATGKLHLPTKEGLIEKFPCLYSTQSLAGTIISPDNNCTMSSHLTQWEQVGDTLTGKGLICFRNKHDDIVATLPTYQDNGLWFTELKAIRSSRD